MNQIGSVLAVLGVLTLGARTTTNPPASYGDGNQGNVHYSGYGVVHSIEIVKQDSGGIGGSGYGMGTVASAVVGGVVGSQVGSGSGATAATVIGAAGGAYVGHELEKRYQQQADAYKITVRMDDGFYQSLMQNTNPGLRVGDRVRVDNGAVQRY